METVKIPEQALAHLFFHFCKKDGTFDEGEIDFVAAKFVQMGLKDRLDFKKEVSIYQSYQQQLKDDPSFLEYMIRIIHPVNTLALFSWCVEICLSDDLISGEEDNLLNDLANVLQIEEDERELIKKVMVERKVAELKKIF